MHLWLNCGASAEEYLRVIQAVHLGKAAIPLVIQGRRWPLPASVSIAKGVADFSAIAPQLAVHMPPECVGALLRVGGSIREAVLAALRCVPVAAQHVLNVRRADLYWFIATCNYRLSCGGIAITPMLHAAIYQPWEFHVGTTSLRDFTWAATASEARFARPGVDIVVGGTPAAAVSLRDKTLLLYLLLWGKPAYATEKCPPCAPAVIRALVAALTANAV